jgi:hypothetical protein
MRRRGGIASHPAALVLVSVVALGAVSGCGADPAHLGPTGVDGLTIPTPSPGPADFDTHAQNDWFPLGQGTRWTYRQYLPTGTRELVATVLPTSRRIAGIDTTAVRWQVLQRGRARIAMVRWYAVDSAGNVWWFGQRLAPRAPRLDPLATASWQAGVAGAQAGVVLTARPRVGDGYYNARQSRVVQRRSTVVSITAVVSTVQRTYRDTVATQDLSSLAPLHVVQSYYGRGLGLVAQQDTRAISTSLSLLRMTPGLPRPRGAG